MSWPSRLSTTMTTIPCHSVLEKEKKDRPKEDLLRLSASVAFGAEKYNEKVPMAQQITDMERTKGFCVVEYGNIQIFFASF